MLLNCFGWVFFKTIAKKNQCNQSRKSSFRKNLELYFTGFYASEAEKSLNICLKWIYERLFVFHSWLFKRQHREMVKHTETIRRLLPTNCLSVFDHFWGLACKC